MSTSSANSSYIESSTSSGNSTYSGNGTYITNSTYSGNGTYSDNSTYSDTSTYSDKSTSEAPSSGEDLYYTEEDYANELLVSFTLLLRRHRHRPSPPVRQCRWPQRKWRAQHLWSLSGEKSTGGALGLG